MLTNRLKIFLVLFSILYWVLVSVYFVVLRYMGLGRYAPPDLHYGNLVAYSVVVGFFIGLLFGLFPVSGILRFRKRKSFLSVVFLSTVCYVLFFITIIFFTSWYGNTLQFAGAYVFSAHGLTVLFHLSVSSLLYHFILQINKKFGPGVLLEYSFGNYFTPKVEERAFMFLDLKSSTQLAEMLEHVSYSRMMQDCYAELTLPILKCKAHVYQYVGDEVVVSWKMNRSFSAAFCCDFFYAFRERLDAKKEEFLKAYGVCPQFKAGLHCGKVTVAEVGEIKTEIAYHGDVLNTASRIQALCNHFQKDFLLSESMVQQLPEQYRQRVDFVVEAALKGKETTTKIFAISR